MKLVLSLKLFFFCFITLSIYSCSQQAHQRAATPKILVFTKTDGWHHESIAAGSIALQKLGSEHGIGVDTTSNSQFFNEDSLRPYAAIVFLSTTGNILEGNQEIALERYLQSGGGFVGIHAASDAEYDWRWYVNMIGASFDNHPAQQNAILHIEDSNHLATKGLPKNWQRFDEWYNFKNLAKDNHVLISIDEKSYQGGKNGASHPMAWYKSFDGGRVFYTELGHTNEAFNEPLYLQHLWGGIQYAMGDNKADYTKAHSVYAPEETAFTKTQLVTGQLYEPTEISVLPNLDVLIAQRKGEILLYKNDTKKLHQIAFLNVYHKALDPKVNSEEGLLGIQADPDFDKNHFVYVYYSAIDTPMNRLSRFTLTNDTLLPSSEKMILQFYEQRNICCHTGGSIAFGPDKNLFVSTGDNTTPFDEPKQKYLTHSFAPLDDRPGHLQYDERRSSGNTNDLRGKILRIKVHPDGTYTIPAGNLFDHKETKARPEIYVMGDRNPYRIAVDPKRGWLYWGEVGPDAPNDSLDTRGPRGYDEINQAKKAGFFGWPFFIGNNYAYHSFDYTNGKPGPAFDPKHPINDSKNNTGLKDLPPAQAAFIWYPYDRANDFPSMGSGSRTAMAGPTYYSDLYPAATRYPSYYDGKVLIYEWMRGFMKFVTMDKDGNYLRMEPFMSANKWKGAIDVELGPDGRLYVLEYGLGWFTKNPDAGLTRIDYIKK